MPQAAKANQRLGRHQRITQSTQFKEAFDQQRKWVGQFMVLWLRSGEDASLRLGVVTSKKVGSAVDRARARRLMREAYRRQRSDLKGTYDVVLVGRASILKAKWPSITDDLKTLMRKAGLLS